MTAEKQRPASIGESLKALFGHAEYQRLIELGKQAPPEEVELVCPRCKGHGWLRLDVMPGHQDFGRIIECQCGIVADRRANVYLAASRIPVEYADLDLTTYPDQDIASAVSEWWHQRPSPWLLLCGDLGVGKTGLEIGLVKKALSNGRTALFRPFVELLSDIRATYRSRDGSAPDEASLMNATKESHVLALDDIGAARVTDWAQERLFEILNYRYNERRTTILTTNLGPSELEEYVGARICSRINGMSWVYEILGPNLRERAS